MAKNGEYFYDDFGSYLAIRITSKKDLILRYS